MSSCAGTFLILRRRSRPSYCVGHVPHPALAASVERVAAASARQTRRAARPTGAPPRRSRVRWSRPSRTSRVPHPARAQCRRAGRCPRRASRRRPAGWPVPAHGGRLRAGLAGSVTDPRPAAHDPGQNQRPATRDPERLQPPGPARTFVNARPGPDICQDRGFKLLFLQYK